MIQTGENTYTMINIRLDYSKIIKLNEANKIDERTLNNLAKILTINSDLALEKISKEQLFNFSENKNKNFVLIQESEMNSYQLIINSLVKAFDNFNKWEAGSHRHQHSLAHQITKLLFLLELKLPDRFYYSNILVAFFFTALQYNIFRIKEQFQPLFNILVSDYTHADKKLLMRPFFHEFKEECMFRFHNYNVLDEYNHFRNVIAQYLKYQEEQTKSITTDIALIENRL